MGENLNMTNEAIKIAISFINFDASSSCLTSQPQQRPFGDTPKLVDAVSLICEVELAALLVIGCRMCPGWETWTYGVGGIGGSQDDDDDDHSACDKMQDQDSSDSDINKKNDERFLNRRGGRQTLLIPWTLSELETFSFKHFHMNNSNSMRRRNTNEATENNKGMNQDQHELVSKTHGGMLDHYMKFIRNSLRGRPEAKSSTMPPDMSGIWNDEVCHEGGVVVGYICPMNRYLISKRMLLNCRNALK
jgi:hypothetical protein